MLVLLLAAGSAGAQFADLLDPTTRTHLARALDGINLSPDDLNFAKDVSEPRAALLWSRELLREPTRVAPLAAETWTAAAEPAALWTALPRWLEAGPAPAPTPAPPAEPAAWDKLPPPWPELLSAFYAEAAAARATLDHALRDLPAADRGYLATSALSDVFDPATNSAGRAVLLGLGVDAVALDQVAAEAGDLDPRPAASNFLARAARLDRAALLAAAQRFEAAVAQLATRAAGVTNWPGQPIAADTALGRVALGTVRDDRHAGPALLILDPAGDDLYGEGCGAVNGVVTPGLATVIDLGGHDRYTAREALGAGAALFGVAVVLDRAGDDTYRAAHLGQAAGLFGVAVLDDGAGDDRYTAGMLAQAAGVYGVGVLRDHSGRDAYEVGQKGQGFAGVFGVGLLYDRAGTDRYFAGGGAADTDRHDDRFLSLAQGFSIGLRPFIGGGLGVLADGGGNDVYQADVFGQGAAYWYAAGLLLDAGGHDSYQVFQYGQGSGIHLAAGLLADAGGTDRYSGGTLTQGNGHDYGVGFLFERGGDDFYSADTFSQGRAMNNALGVLVDRAGNDVYAARDNLSCQGIGNEGGHRDYGCLGLLLDLGGSDQYSTGARNNDLLERPHYGAVYDAEAGP